MRRNRLTPKLNKPHVSVGSLPPTAALRALEAACRHRSYTLAAEELSVTHSAISHQIRYLEDFIGTPLFARHGKTMQPLPAAIALVEHVRPALALLSTAFSRTKRGPQRGHLMVSVLPSIAERWLAPRLDRFLRRNPSIRLSLAVSMSVSTFRDDGIDAAIRYGRAPSPELESRVLGKDLLVPVASPGLLAGASEFTPEHFNQLPVICNHFEPWNPWFKAAGWTMDEPTSALSIDNASVALAAAEAGAGVLLSRIRIAGASLLAGRLVALSSVRATPESSYHLVWPKSSRKRVMIEALGDWLETELALDMPEPGNTPGKRMGG